ncbi:MAG: hypothetical protein IPK68_21845 [Bdellovibrionales bacterium]|nr:hypothetical protein [Bdellovibrionales bacterium]
MQLGEDIITNRSFIGNLEIAIDDFLQFEPALRNYIDTKLTLINLIDGLKKLKSASLVGQFMEIFLKADPVTRQYIFSEIIDLKYGVDGERTIALKGTSTPGEKFGVDEAISRLLRKTLEILQEEAFFMYESSGDSRRPPLSKAKEKRPLRSDF